MKETANLIGNILLFAIAGLILGSMQTSLWFQIFGNIPAPAFWIPILVYLFLFRRVNEAVPMMYFLCIILSTMTTISEGLFMLLCLALGLTVRIVKQRVYWPGHTYFMMVCGCAALLFHLYHMVGSMILEQTTISRPEILSWIIEALLTPLISPLLYIVFLWFDFWTEREQPAEVKAQVL